MLGTIKPHPPPAQEERLSPEACVGVFFTPADTRHSSFDVCTEEDSQLPITTGKGHTQATTTARLTSTAWRAVLVGSQL